MSTHTLTALFSDASSAERAADLLRGIGVPEASLEIHQAVAGDSLPGNAAGAGLFGVADPLLPSAAAGSDLPRTVVVAMRVPDELTSQALAILREDAIDVEQQHDAA
ncbi:MAG: hypothetical protein U1E59_14400 [Amaricoccus sp.]